MPNTPSFFPRGFPGGVVIQGLPVLNTYPSKVFWVHSTTGSDGNPGTFSQPLATIDAAIGKCTASRGDVIMVKAGHAETITAAGGIACDVIGVSIVGLGTGNLRPTISFGTATTASILITAASTSITNIIGVSAIDALVNPIHVQAAGCTIDMEWQDPSSALQAVCPVLTTAAADNLVLNLKVVGIISGGTAPVNAVVLVGVNTATVTMDFYGRASTAVVEFLTTACTNIEVYGYMYNSGAVTGAKNVVDTVTGSTWYANFYDGAAGTAPAGGSAAALTSASLGEGVARKAAAVMTNGLTLFTVAGGPIEVMGLVSICATTNDATASTLQYSATPTVGAAQTISGASASLANAAAGASVTLAGTALSTAALLNANGPNLMANPGTVMVPAGTITAVIGVGSTTGTWTHYLRYKPLAVGVTVS